MRIENSHTSGMRLRPCSALTLVETLVVILVLGLLIALLLPAVQAVRESARVAQCVNNLRQITLAMHSYQTREGRFPAQGMPIQLPTATFRGNDYSAFTHVLADLELRPIFDSINFQSGQSAGTESWPEQATFMSVTLSVFLCPSDGNPSPTPNGPVDYRVCMGSQIGTFPSPQEVNRLGVFEIYQWVSPAQVTDGLSTTAMLSERLLGSGDLRRPDPARDSWRAGIGAYQSVGDEIAACQSGPGSSSSFYCSGGWSWAVCGYDTTSYNHIFTPNSAWFDCGGADAQFPPMGSSESGIYPARSMHRGGVSVATADGAVHWVSNTVSSRVWQALGTRSGSEMIEPPF